MSPRTRTSRRTTPEAPSGRVHPAGADDDLNQRMAAALRQAAEVRAARDAASASEEISANLRLRAAVDALVEGRRA